MQNGIGSYVGMSIWYKYMTVVSVIITQPFYQQFQ